MTIPAHQSNRLLPPFVGEPAVGERSPYRVTSEELVKRFHTSERRGQILAGFFQYRDALRRANLTTGWQWLAGSFVEELDREPNDIDVVSFAEVDKVFVAEHLELIRPEQTKAAFLCDAYFVNLRGPISETIDSSTYWYGLFSHQRSTFLWKGLLQISLDAGEAGDEVGLALLRGAQ